MIISKKIKKKIIEDILNDINFDMILYCYNNTDLKLEYPYYYTGELTVDKIKGNLKIILDKVLENTHWETIDNHWLIYYDPHSIEDTAVQLQVFFIPFTSNIYEFKELVNKQEELELRLELAVSQEEFHLAARIQKELEQLNKRKRKKINKKNK